MAVVVTERALTSPGGDGQSDDKLWKSHSFLLAGDTAVLFADTAVSSCNQKLTGSFCVLAGFLGRFCRWDSVG